MFIFSLEVHLLRLWGFFGAISWFGEASYDFYELHKLHNFFVH